MDLTVAPGQVFGLLGANGAGKTTAIRMLCGMLKPNAGEIRVGGVDMVQHGRSARGRIGYVAQRFALYGDLSVWENLRLQAGLYGLSGTNSVERLDWALQQLALTERRQTKAGELPLGFQRRLALAAALLHEPDVLFLDEPTSGVDPGARQDFWEMIYELAESGIGILVTTHFMDEALFCDRLALMHAGRIIEQGTPQDLLKRPLSTPIVELHSPQSAAWVRQLESWPDVLEIVPHAGQLRIRLRAGTVVDDSMRRMDELARQQQLGLGGLGLAKPELEDVFVALLEQAEQGAIR
jgi:ABC-2 type transport system ATP-binding protein